MDKFFFFVICLQCSLTNQVRWLWTTFGDWELSASIVSLAVTFSLYRGCFKAPHLDFSSVKCSSLKKKKVQKCISTLHYPWLCQSTVQYHICHCACSLPLTKVMACGICRLLNLIKGQSSDLSIIIRSAEGWGVKGATVPANLGRKQIWPTFVLYHAK